MTLNTFILLKIWFLEWICLRHQLIGHWITRTFYHKDFDKKKIVRKIKLKRLNRLLLGSARKLTCVKIIQLTIKKLKSIHKNLNSIKVEKNINLLHNARMALFKIPYPYIKSRVRKFYLKFQVKIKKWWRRKNKTDKPQIKFIKGKIRVNFLNP